MFSTFGNKVKIKNSVETEKSGLVGKIGIIQGETTPSMMDFEIVGTPSRDYAVSVHFEDIKQSYWFDEDLLEHIDNGVGTTISLDGVDKNWSKGEEGEWQESESSEVNKKWWQFWKT